MVPIVLLFILSAVVSPAVDAAADEVVIKTFPEDAYILLEGPSGNRYRPSVIDLDADRWRAVATDPRDVLLVLQAPGYREKRINLPESPSEPLRIEERLEPERGHLTLREELPTGRSPKSVTFLPDGRMVVAQLRGRGIDVYDSDGIRREIAIPPGGGGDEGFVEFAVLTDRGELWVSQMHTDQVHRLSLPDLSYLSTHGTGGGWPKVLLAAPDESVVYAANWEGENIGVLDARSGNVLRTIAVGGQPRGLATSHDGRYLWVCIFSTGNVEIYDTRSGELFDRLEFAPGAARHIVADDEGKRMFLSDMYRGTVAIIDVETRRILQRRRVGSNVNTIALSLDDRFLYVSVRGRNNSDSYLVPGPEFGRLVVLNTTDLSVVQEIWGRNQPTGLAVSADGATVALTDFLDDNLALFSRRSSTF